MPFERKILETDRLWLRPQTVEHSAYLYELMSSPGFIENIGDRGINSVEDARRYMERMQSGEGHVNEYYNHVAIRKTDGKFLGNCGFFRRDGLPGYDIGYAFLPEAHGHGYATEAAKEVLKYVWEQGIPEIYGITLPANIPSCRVLEKIGLTLLDYVYLPNDPEKLCLYRAERPKTQ